jgi:hypothetical protein
MHLEMTERDLLKAFHRPWSFHEQRRLWNVGYWWFAALIVVFAITICAVKWLLPEIPGLPFGFIIGVGFFVCGKALYWHTEGKVKQRTCELTMHRWFDEIEGLEAHPGDEELLLAILHATKQRTRGEISNLLRHAENSPALSSLSFVRDLRATV